jgi:hypothetical protein
MGTNYFCRIIPSKERRKELHDAIEANDFPLINKLTDEMYNPIRVEYGKDHIIGGVVHLGKRSGGWKFLWNPNVFVIRNGHLEDNNGTRRYVPDPDTPLYTYPLTKNGIKSFIDREDVLIYDEYDELQDKEEFWKMALEWGQPDGWDAAGYEKEYKEHIYPVTGELTNLLRQEGYKFTSLSNSDFYSDGLRFAGFTDFS